MVWVVFSLGRASFTEHRYLSWGLLCVKGTPDNCHTGHAFHLLAESVYEGNVDCHLFFFKGRYCLLVQTFKLCLDVFSYELFWVSVGFHDLFAVLNYYFREDFNQLFCVSQDTG